MIIWKFWSCRLQDSDVKRGKRCRWGGSGREEKEWGWTADFIEPSARPKWKCNSFTVSRYSRDGSGSLTLLRRRINRILTRCYSNCEQTWVSSRPQTSDSLSLSTISLCLHFVLLCQSHLLSNVSWTTLTVMAKVINILISLWILSQGVMQAQEHPWTYLCARHLLLNPYIQWQALSEPSHTDTSMDEASIIIRKFIVFLQTTRKWSD